MASRNMQRVELALGAGMLKLPHPLLGYAVDFERVGGRALHVHVKPRSPDKNHQGDAQRNHAPGDLQQHGTMDLLGFLAWFLLILDDEKQNQARDQQREKSGDRHQKQVDIVHLSGRGRGLLRKKWHVKLHLFDCPNHTALLASKRSRRNMMNMNPPRTSSVARAVILKIVKIAAPYFPVAGS